jgi:hypothetical protein
MKRVWGAGCVGMPPLPKSDADPRCNPFPGSDAKNFGLFGAPLTCAASGARPARQASTQQEWF